MDKEAVEIGRSASPYQPSKPESAGLAAGYTMISLMTLAQTKAHGLRALSLFTT
ncbi:MAG: hypothetical protein RRZ24_05205 [Clostridia bacterium]